jgi:hypothetical protein
LIGFAYLLAIVRSGFLFEAHLAKLKEELISPFKQYYKKKISADTHSQPVNRLRSKAILMIVIFLIYIKNIAKSLQCMVKTAQKISEYALFQLIGIKLRGGLN